MSNQPDPGMDVKMAPPGLPDLAALLAGEAVDETRIEALCQFVDARFDCADFRVMSLLRVAYSNNPQLSQEIRQRVRSSLLGFKYWGDEAGEDSMCFWSENHQVIFASCEYLAGQLFPEERFNNRLLSGQQLTGKDRMARAKARLLDWLGDRFRFGFTEWLSNTYYEQDVAALALLIELAQDAELVTRASMVLDLLLLDCALHRFDNYLLGSAGRAYEMQKKDPSQAEVNDILRHAFGTAKGYQSDHGSALGPGLDELGIRDARGYQPDRGSALFVTATKYRIPPVLQQIATYSGEALIQEGFGLELAEVQAQVAPWRTERVGAFFWAMEAFTNPASIRSTMWLFNRWRLRANRFLSPLGSFARLPSKLLPTLVRLLNPATQGVAIQRADVTTWRSDHGLLSSAQAYHPGEFGDQQHLWQASLPGGINVFATHPGAAMFDETARNFSPAAWVGNGINPLIGQAGPVLLSLHNLRQRRGLLEAPRQQLSHLFWPADKFDESTTGAHADGGTWLAGRSGSGCIGVISTHRLNPGEPDELIQEGELTGWLVVLGQGQDLAEFADRLAATRFELHAATIPGLRAELSPGLASSPSQSNRASKDSTTENTRSPTPGNATAGALSPESTATASTSQAHAHSNTGRYELIWGKTLTHNGSPVAAKHPRLASPFGNIPRLPERIDIEFQGHSLHLDWAEQTRLIDVEALPEKPEALRKAMALCDDLIETTVPEKLPWMWGPALLGFALLQLAQHTGQQRYLDWVLRYARHHLAQPPRIDYSDHVAPALVTSELQALGYDEFAPLTNAALQYLRNCPKPLPGVPNHLGKSGWNWIYPDSVWVDSLMMFGVFPARYGQRIGDSELVELAAQLPSRTAAVLQEPVSRLWHHAWLKRLNRPFPKALWGRGNGWVIASLPMILDALPESPERESVLELLETTSQALLPLQRADGSWPTALGPKPQGYRELSATALIAAGWLHSIHAGYLPKRYLDPARGALNAVTNAITRRQGRLVMPEISGPTIPISGLAYRLTPCGDNHPWGVAGYVLAALQDCLLSSQSPA